MTAAATTFALGTATALVIPFVLQGWVQAPTRGGWQGLFWVAVVAAGWTICVGMRSAVGVGFSRRSMAASTLTPSPGTPGEGWGEGLREWLKPGRHADALPNPLLAYREREPEAMTLATRIGLTIFGLGVFAYIGPGDWADRATFALLPTAAWGAFLLATLRAEGVRGSVGPALVAASAGLIAAPVLAFNGKCTAFAWLAAALAVAALCTAVAALVRPAVHVGGAAWGLFWLLYVGVLAVATEFGYAALPSLDAAALALGPLVSLLGLTTPALRPYRFALAAAVLALPLAQAVRVALSYREAGLL